MSEHADSSPSVLAFRASRNERRLDKLDEWRVLVDDERSTTREQLKFVREEMRELKEGLDSLRKTLVAAAITVAISFAGISLSVLFATGKI